MHVLEVTIPDAEEMYVVEVQEPEFDAVYKKQMSELMFGDEEIYYNDLARLPRKGIEERRESCQAVYQLAQRLEEGKIVLSYDNIEYLPERYQFDPENEEGWKDLLDQELLSCDSALETAGASYTPVSEYDADEYQGTYSGIAYELSFLERKNVRKRIFIRSAPKQ